MKNIFIIVRLISVSLILILNTSCSVDDNNIYFRTDFLPVESVDIPTEFTLGETYPIKVTYLKPTTCHVFKEFYYSKNLNERTVAPITIVYDDNNCQILDNVTEDATFNFMVTRNGSYIFKLFCC